LSEKKGLYEKAKGEMGLFEKILAEIPGFRGYKEKELRRETDKLIRDHIYRKLSEARKDIKDVFQRLSERRIQEVLADMDKLVMKFDRVNERIHHASYGYAGFYDVLKVEEDKLDAMISFDEGLLDETQKICEKSSDFKKEAMKNRFDNAREQIDELLDLLESLEETFDEREEVIKGAK
jgi:hypothetical protein